MIERKKLNDRNREKVYFDYSGNKIKMGSKKKAILGNIYTRPHHRISEKIKTHYNFSTEQVVAKIKRAKNKLRNRNIMSMKLNSLFQVSKEAKDKGIPRFTVTGNSAQTILENFEVSKGVTLKTRNYVLKNRNRDQDFIDEEGRRRVTKKFFEKKLKNVKKGKKFRSVSKVKKKKLREIRRKRERELAEKVKIENKKRIIERLHSMTTSQESSPRNMSKKKKGLKIYDKNYEKFLKKISGQGKMHFRRASTPKQSERSPYRTKKDFQQEEADDKLHVMNMRLRERETQMHITNRPVRKEMTYKNLKISDYGRRNNSLSFIRRTKFESGSMRPRERKVKRNIRNRSYQLKDHLSQVHSKQFKTQDNE